MKTLKQIAISLLFLAFLAVLSIDSTFAGVTGVMLQIAAMIFLSTFPGKSLIRLEAWSANAWLIASSKST